jgi:zinc transporter
MDLDGARYGSERDGLLCGYVFAPCQPGRAIDADQAAAILATHAAEAGDDFLWLHFNLANQASERWLAQRLSLPEGYHSLLHHETSTRLEANGDWLIAVVNDVGIYGTDASTVSTMTLCVARRILVSARHTPLRSIERLRESVKAGECFESAVELLAHLLNDQAEVLAQIVRDATAQIDRIEDRMMAGHIAASRPKLGALRRMLVRLQRLLSPEPAALFRLLNKPPAWIAASDLQKLRESAEELGSALTDSMALVDRARLLQEELLAVVNERTGKTLFILTVVTVVTLPMTIIPGLFGMNVGGVPLQGTAGFWAVLAIAISFAGLGVFLVLRGTRES